ncbi:MAG: GNAT family N-acetyltransferase [Caulobacteraceae bacterium]
MPPIPVLETERLWLRPTAATDAASCQARFPKWEIVQYMPGVPWPYPDDGAATHIERALAENASGEKNHWGVWLKGGPSEMIGAISLWPDDGVSRDMRGFWLDPEFQGRGLMTEAADRVNDYALFELGWPHLWLSNLLENLPSARVKERQGARLIGEEAKTYLRGSFTRQVWKLSAAAWKRRRKWPEHLTLRVAQPRDAGAMVRYLAALNAEADLDTIGRRPIPSLAAERATIARFAAQDRSFFMLAWRGRKLVGLADIEAWQRPEGRHAAPIGISVARSARGQGVGRALMLACIERARLWEGFCRIELEVASWNSKAIRLYESLGFRHEGRRVKGMNLRGRPEDTLRMALVW